MKELPILTAIGIYLILVSVFWWWRPSISFFPDGTVKPFGGAGAGSTLFPVWWFTNVFSMASYILMIYVRHGVSN